MDVRILRYADRFAALKGGGVVPPLMATVFPAFGCNFHCAGCHYNSENEEGWEFIQVEPLLRILTEARAYGLKSLVITGGGEPLFHERIHEIFDGAYALGLRVGTITNGSRLLRDDLLREKLFSRNVFVRISIYSETDIEKTCDLAAAPRQCGLGAKLLVGKDSLAFNLAAARRLAESAFDYIEVKAERVSPNDIYEPGDAFAIELERQFRSISPKVKGSLRKEFMPIRSCYLTPIHVFLDASGVFSLCCYFHGRKETHSYGSIYSGLSFKEIWEGSSHARARASIKTVDCNPWDCRFFRYLQIAEQSLSGAAPEFSRHDFDDDDDFI
jgi:MoaA/NifB/PqqE/SkfB family radical SAM enzyme